MPVGQAIRVYDVVEHSTENMWYEITVRYHGKIVASFVKPTMREARLAYEQAGYQPIAWREGSRIVLQGE